jgi:hypothetical protein
VLGSQKGTDPRTGIVPERGQVTDASQSGDRSQIQVRIAFGIDRVSHRGKRAGTGPIRSPKGTGPFPKGQVHSQDRSVAESLSLAWTCSSIGHRL